VRGLVHTTPYKFNTESRQIKPCETLSLVVLPDGVDKAETILMPYKKGFI
jgi:hypothetical protein